MKTGLFFATALLVWITGAPGAKPAMGQEAEPRFPVTVTDDLGRAVTFAEPPRRIVALGHAPYAQLAALGVRPVGAFVNPGFARHFDPLFADPRPVPSVVNIDWSPDPELIVQLRPDAVFGWNVSEAQMVEGIAPYLAIREFRSVEDLKTNLRTLGRILDVENRAEQAVQRFERRLESYRRLSPRDRSVIFVSGRDLRRFSVAAADNMICQLADAVADCRSKSPNSKLPYVELSVSSLLAMDPDVIVLGYFRVAGRAAYVEALAKQPLWNRLRAVQTNRVVFYDGYQDLSIRGVPAAERLLDLLLPKLYPEKFPEPITDAQIMAASQAR